MIPRHFQFIYIYNKDTRPFNVNHYFSILSQAIINKADKITIYTNNVDELEINEYIEKLDNIFEDKFNIVDCTDIFNRKANNGNEIPYMSHKSDIIRLYYLYQNGGVYCDVDTYAVKPMPDEWFSEDRVVWGREITSETCMCPDIIIAPKEDQFIKDVLNMHLNEYDPNFATYESGHWAYYAVVRPYQMYEKDQRSSNPKYNVNLIDAVLLQPFNETYHDTEELFWLDCYQHILKNSYCIHTWENRNKNILKNFSLRYFRESSATYAQVVRNGLKNSGLSHDTLRYIFNEF
jgi:mannosyltransferase OCH1-like enzyme